MTLEMRRAAIAVATNIAACSHKPSERAFLSSIHSSLWQLDKVCEYIGKSRDRGLLSDRTGYALISECEIIRMSLEDLIAHSVN